MKLNPDCVRDVLFSIENVTDCTTSWTYTKGKCTCDFLSRYSHEEIAYHVLQCKHAKLITNLRQYDMYTTLIVNDLTPAGHQFLDFARSSTIWEKVKSTSKKIGAYSLPSLLEIGVNTIAEFIKSS